MLSSLVGTWSGYCSQFSAVYQDATTYCIPYKSLTGGPLVYSYSVVVSSDGSVSYSTGNATVVQTTGNRVNDQTTSTSYFIGSYTMTGKISSISQYASVIPGSMPQSLNSCVSISWDTGSDMNMVWSLLSNGTQLTEEGRYSVPGNDYMSGCSAKGRLYCTNQIAYNYVCNAQLITSTVDSPPPLSS
jgi:hypothetical protein